MDLLQGWSAACCRSGNSISWVGSLGYDLLECANCTVLPIDRASTTSAAGEPISGGHTADPGIPLLRGGHECCGIWLVGVPPARAYAPVGWP